MGKEYKTGKNKFTILNPTQVMINDNKGSPS